MNAVNTNNYYCKDSHICAKSQQCKYGITEEVEEAHRKIRAAVKLTHATMNCLEDIRYGNKD